SGAGNERFDARRMPRSSATQHKTREWRNSCSPPRTSQIPASGRCQWSQTQFNSRVRFIHKSWEIGAPYLLLACCVLAEQRRTSSRQDRLLLGEQVAKDIFHSLPELE